MRREPPIAACAFGWGQELRLYAHTLIIGNNDYPLRDLTHIRPYYKQVMGVASVRLELRFGRQKITLRGIADVGAAQKISEYLTTHYLGVAQGTPAEAEAGGASRGWSRTREQPSQVTVTPVLA